MKLTSDEKKRLKVFEKSIGYSFKKKELLFKALTHKSFVNEKSMAEKEHNERLEYLGDAVLELAISHILIDRFPKFPEGELSKMRAAIVNEDRLAGVARDLELGSFLNMGKGEDITGGRDKPSLLSDALEAVLGAIYIDRGFDKAKAVVAKNFKEVLDGTHTKEFYKDFKTKLQEVSQARYRQIPRYKLVSETGPDHKKLFEVHLYIGTELFGTGLGKSKKSAEQSAAQAALEKIGS